MLRAQDRGWRGRLIWNAVFGIAFGYVEAAVVVYLRALYYPGGFAFPLKAIPTGMIGVEVFREAATIVMLVAVGVLTCRGRWGRFGAFLVAFGVWDISFYLWLMALVRWPSSLFDWDILFLIPVPWIGPVVAAMIIALVMIVGGCWLVMMESRGSGVAMTWQSFAAGVIGTVALLYSFMYDTDATLRGAMPRAYPYWMLIVGTLGYIAGFGLLGRRSAPSDENTVFGESQGAKLEGRSEEPPLDGER